MVRLYYVLDIYGDERDIEAPSPMRAAECVLRIVATKAVRVHSSDPMRHDSRFYTLDSNGKVVASKASIFYDAQREEERKLEERNAASYLDKREPRNKVLRAFVNLAQATLDDPSELDAALAELREINPTGHGTR